MALDPDCRPELFLEHVSIQQLVQHVASILLALKLYEGHTALLNHTDFFETVKLVEKVV